MIKVFLRDFITPFRVKWSLIAIAVLTVVLSFFQLDKFTSATAANILGLMVCFFPTMYVIYTYATLDNIRLYLTMPVGSQKTIISFCLALFVDTILERMAFVAVAILFLFQNPPPIILFLPISGFVTVLINVVILLGFNSKKTYVWLTGFILLFSLIANCIFTSNLLLKIGLTILIGLISLFAMRGCESIDLAISRKGTKNGRLSVNYFFNVLFSEKIYLLNTALIFIFAAVFLFGFVEEGNPIMASIVWCLVAVNTPVTTMLSGDKSLMRQSDMLPHNRSSVRGMYRRFLVIYFALSNAIVFALCLIRTGFSVPYLVIQYIVAVVVEVEGSLYLESKKRITNWQTAQQLWRNPRKYIIPAIVLIISFATSFVANLF